MGKSEQASLWRDFLSSASLLQPLQSPRATLLWDMLMGESLGERRLHLTSLPGRYLCVISAPISAAAASSTRTRSSLPLIVLRELFQHWIVWLLVLTTGYSREVIRLGEWPRWSITPAGTILLSPTMLPSSPSQNLSTSVTPACSP